jgi:hypothetical protein
MKITLNEIKRHKASQSLLEKLLHYLGKSSPDDELIDLVTILESNGLPDALWCADTLYDQKQRMKLSALFLKEVYHLMSEKLVQDLEALYQYIDGAMTEDEFLDSGAARPQVWACADPSHAAWVVAWHARRAGNTEQALSEMKAKQVEILRKFLEETR